MNSPMKIKDAKVYPLSDLAQQAQAQVQAEYKDIDPVIGVSHNLRKSGFAADTLTIKNIKNDKRILMVLHDHKPDVVDYEFGIASQDPSFDFQEISLNDLTHEKLYQWMVQVFS